MEPPVKDDRPINEMIQAAQVRLIGAEGEQIGVVTRDDALDRAANLGLDLVIVADNADPPVCKIMDYGKFKYEEQKKKNFLGEGDKVKVTMRFRGREMAHQDLGLKVLHRVRDDLEELTKIEQFPKMEGRQMVMVLAPK